MSRRVGPLGAACLFLGYRGDERAPVRERHEQAFGAEARKRLAHRTGRRPHLLGDCLLGETLAHRQLAGQDLLAQTRPDRIPERFVADLGQLDINDNVRWHDMQGTGGAQPSIADREARRVRDYERRVADWTRRSRRAATALSGWERRLRLARGRLARAAGG